MKRIIDFFLRYNVREWKKNKLQTAYNIFGIAISIAITLAIQVIRISNEEYIRKNSTLVNGGDISIGSFREPISNIQISALDELKSKGYIDYTITSFVSNRISNGERSTMVVLRFISANEYSVIQPIQDSQILLTKDVAERLEVKQNDIVKTFSEYSGQTEEYKILEIIEKGELGTYNNNTESDMKIYGYAYLSKANLQHFADLNSNIVTRIFITNKGFDMQKTLSAISPIFLNSTITTSNDLFEQKMKEIETTTITLSIIGLITFAIAGISLAETMYVSVIKRKKEISILKSLGMNNAFLMSLMILEAVVVCLLGNIIGIPVGLLVSSFLNMIVYGSSLKSLVVMSVLPMIIKTFIFSLGLSVIFSLIPVSVCSSFKCNVILREQPEDKVKYRRYIFISLSFISIAFSIYIESYFGILITVILAFLGGVLYEVSMFLLLVVSKIKSNNKKLLLVFRNIGKQKKSITIVLLTLVVGIISMGLTINLSSGMQNSLMTTVQNQLHYNTLVSAKLDDQDNVEHILSEADGISSFYKSLRTDVALKNVGEKTVSAVISEDPQNPAFSRLNDLTIEGLNLEDEEVFLNIGEGRILDQSDINRNTAVVTEDMSQILNIQVGDTILLEISDQQLPFDVVGIKGSTIVNTSDIMVSYKILQDIVNWNSVIYYVSIDNKGYDSTVKQLNSELVNAFILKMDDVLGSLSKSFNKQSSLFTYISFFSIVSSIFLIMNLSFMMFIHRRKEFAILRSLGALEKDVRSIIFNENALVGLIGGLISAGIIAFMADILLEGLLQVDYTQNPFLSAALIAFSMLITCLSARIIIPNMKNQEISAFFRNE